MTVEGAARSGHIIVCGLHDVGLRIVEQLHAAGEQVVVVDDAPDPRLLRIIADWGIPHLPGSARRAAVLNEAGLMDASALICVEDGDLPNLEIALLARRLRPDVRLVVQLSNPAVGRAVERVTGPGTVLDVATLAAPTFSEACLQRGRHSFELAGLEFHIVELEADSAGTLRSLFGDLAPIAMIPADGSEMHVCPGRDLTVVPGDRVVVIGNDHDDLDQRRVHLLPDTEVVPVAPGRRRIGVAWRYVASFATETERSLRLTLAAILGLAVVSVLLLEIGYRKPGGGGHISPIDSIFFTSETLTTVGYGEVPFSGQNPWLRIWVVVLMILGATLVTIVYALLTNLLVSRRIEQSLGRQQVTGMADHVILVGLGAVGLRVLERLTAAGQPVVVLERDENNRFLANARALKVPVVIGDSTVTSSLAAANLRTARAVAVLTSSDLANIETGLAVDDLLGERRTIVPVVLRVFDRELARTLESGFNFANVRSTSALAAPWFVGAALGLDILNTFYIDQQPMLIGRLTIAPDGGLQGKTMLDLSARIRVIAISRSRSAGRLELPPRRDTRFEGGDQAYLVGPYEELLNVLKRD